MPQYVVRLTHPPDQCPTANAKTRQMFVKGAPEFPQLAQKLEGVAVVEADKIETVQEFILQSGLVQWNSVRVSQAMSVLEAIESLEKVPPPLY